MCERDARADRIAGEKEERTLPLFVAGEVRELRNQRPGECTGANTKKCGAAIRGVFGGIVPSSRKQRCMERGRKPDGGDELIIAVFEMRERSGDRAEAKACEPTDLKEKRSATFGDRCGETRA